MIIIIIYAFSLSACVSMKVEGTIDTKKAEVGDGRIVVLSHSNTSGNETEAKFTRCIANRLKSKLPTNSYLNNRLFIDVMYPWFEPKQAPAKISDLRNLLNISFIQEKIDELDIRYLVMLSGNTKDVNEKKCEACEIAPVLIGMPGMPTFKKQSNYFAEIWDLKNQVVVADLNARGKGKTYMPIIPVYLIPLPIGGNVRSASCKQLVQQLVKYFTNDVE